MAFETNKFSVAKKIKLPSSDFAVECNVSLGCEIDKILSVGVKANDDAVEVLNGIVNYSGTVDLKIIYMTTDGEINSSCHSCSFSSKFESNDIVGGGDALIVLKVVDSEVESVSGDMVRLVVNINQSGVLSFEKDVAVIGVDDNDICTQSEEIEVVKLVASTKSTFEVESSVSIKENIKKLLSTESQVLLKNVESGTGFVSIQGNVLTRVLYLTDEDKFENFYIDETFKEEVEVDGAEKEEIVEAYLCVKEDCVTTEIENDDSGQKLTVKVPVKANVKVYKNEVITVVCDLYSTKEEINVTTESFENSVVCPIKIVDDKIEGSLTLDEDAPRVDKVLFASGNGVTLTNVYLQDEQIMIEGIAKTNVVYLNDESNSLNSVQVEIPFSFSEKFDGTCQLDLIASTILTDVDVVVKKGRDLYYDAKIKVAICCYYDKVMAVISDASVSEPLAERDYAMEVVFAHSGQSAWDLAKMVHVPVQQITAQNPETAFPLEEDSSIVLYYQG